MLAWVRGRWVHAALSAAFQGLQTLLAGRIRSRLVLEHAAQKILHRQLNAAVNQWQWLLHRARRARWVRTKALAQWINRHTGRAFHTWATKVANSKMTSECSSCAELKERIVVLEEIVKVQASKLTASEQQLADELAAMQRLSIQCQAVAMQSWCQP